MKYRLFLDTNIYDKSCYNFRNAQFEALRDYTKISKLELVINTVIEGEVKRHINENVTRAVQALNRATKDRHLSSFKSLSPFYDIVSKQNTEVWVEACCNEFDTMLLDCHTEHIPLGYRDLETIMDDYFKMRPPFETKKPDEFKDAFVVESVLSDIHDKLNRECGSYDDDFLYCVVSNDKGFCDALESGLLYKEKEVVLIFHELNIFLEFISLMDRNAESLKTYLLSDYGKREVEETVCQAIFNVCELDIETENDDFIEDKEIINIDVLDYKPYVLGIMEEEGKASIAKVAIDVECSIDVQYEYMDGENSYYDKEDQEYWWKTMIEKEGDYIADIELSVSFEISEFEILEKWMAEEENSESCKYSFPVRFLDYLDVPTQITLSPDKLMQERRIVKNNFFDEAE